MTYFNPFASVPRRISSCGVKGSSSIAVVAAGSATDDSVCIARSHRPGPPFVDDAFARTTRAHRRPRVARFVVVAVRPRRRCGVTIPRAFALARALAETRDAMSTRTVRIRHRFVTVARRRRRTNAPRRRSRRTLRTIASTPPRARSGRRRESKGARATRRKGGFASRASTPRAIESIESIESIDRIESNRIESIDRRAMVREKPPIDAPPARGAALRDDVVRRAMFSVTCAPSATTTTSCAVKGATARSQRVRTIDRRDRRATRARTRSNGARENDDGAVSPSARAIGAPTNATDRDARDDGDARGGDRDDCVDTDEREGSRARAARGDIASTSTSREGAIRALSTKRTRD